MQNLRHFSLKFLDKPHPQFSSKREMKRSEYQRKTAPNLHAKKANAEVKEDSSKIVALL